MLHYFISNKIELISCCFHNLELINILQCLIHAMIARFIMIQSWLTLRAPHMLRHGFESMVFFLINSFVLCIACHILKTSACENELRKPVYI